MPRSLLRAPYGDPLWVVQLILRGFKKGCSLSEMISALGFRIAEIGLEGENICGLEKG